LSVVGLCWFVSAENFGGVPCRHSVCVGAPAPRKKDKKNR